jgi:hypothetical protein
VERLQGGQKSLFQSGARRCERLKNLAVDVEDCIVRDAYFHERSEGTDSPMSCFSIAEKVS